MKRITFLTRCACHFNMLYSDFVVLCWCIVFISGIFQVRIFVRKIRTKREKNRKDTCCTHGVYYGVCHGTDHDVAVKTHFSRKKSQETHFRTHGIRHDGHGVRHESHIPRSPTLHSWRSPLGHDVCHGLRDHKSSNKLDQLPPTSALFFPRLLHEFSLFSKSQALYIARIFRFSGSKFILELSEFLNTSFRRKIYYYYSYNFSH